MFMNHIAVGIGEVLWDMLPDGRKIGGAPANFAYHTSQFGIDGYAVSAVGQDILGDGNRNIGTTRSQMPYSESELSYRNREDYTK